jgi:hypothetical protein
MLKRSTLVSASLIAVSSISVTLLAACGANSTEQTGSSVKTVDLPHTPVKWQSIGNCWAYAALGWVESQYLKANNQEINLSETYMSYRHFERQLLGNPSLEEINTGGSWRQSTQIMISTGVMMEGDFVPGEESKTFSQTQSDALEYLNNSLKSGILKSDRSPTTIRAELDTAFGVRLADVTSKIIPVSSVSLGKNPDGSARTVGSELQQWDSFNWPNDWTNYPTESQLPLKNDKLNASQLDLLQRVKRALNDGHPVVMNWWVDFNGLDETGTFDLANVAAKGAGKQGYHSTVIEDYVVSGVNPQTGASFSVGEGEATPELKKLAALYGKIEYFVVKNSWGGAERQNRPSYSRFGVKGYTRLNASYLFGWMRQEDEENKGVYQGPETGLNSFVLPAGY